MESISRYIREFHILGDASDDNTVMESIGDSSEELLDNPISILWSRKDAPESLSERIMTYPKHVARVLFTATILAPIYHMHCLFLACIEFLKLITGQENTFDDRRLPIHLLGLIPVVGSLLAARVYANIWLGFGILMNTEIVPFKVDAPAGADSDDNPLYVRIPAGILMMIPLIGYMLSSMVLNDGKWGWLSEDIDVGPIY